MTQANNVLKDGAVSGEIVARKSDKWIPWYFVAFFVFLAIMDGIFVYIANQTHTGVVTDNAYNEGLKYNQTIAKAEAIEELGWTASVDYQGADILVTLTDKDGVAISGADVDAVFIRPTKEGSDFKAELVEQAPGTYTASANAAQGQWDIRVYATWKQKQFQSVKRVVVQPN